jgi:integrase
MRPTRSRSGAPPTADALEAVLALLPSRYRLPVVVLDATGMRVGELEALRWGDVDEPRGRWRISAATSKTSRPRWVTPPANVFAAVVELVPREDRELDALVFEGFAATDGDQSRLPRRGRAAVLAA